MLLGGHTNMCKHVYSHNVSIQVKSEMPAVAWMGSISEARLTVLHCVQKTQPYCDF